MPGFYGARRQLYILAPTAPHRPGARHTHITAGGGSGFCVRCQGGAVST